MAKIEIIYNGNKVEADDNLTILEFAERQGEEIPTLCHDPRLQPYGSCFVCVVEVKGAKALMPACATKLREGIEIYSKNERVIASRKTALELIASNHYGDCVAPCKIACPANCDVQGYVGLAANGLYDDALRLIKQTIPLPASIGRVCPKFCEDKCRRQFVDESVAIDNVKRFVADRDLNSGKPFMPECKKSIGKKVAVIGGGPAGLAAAYYLRQEGVDVDIYEAQDKLGGMLRYGIPQYRLPKEILDKEIETVTALGVDVKYNKVLGKDFTIDSLKKDGYDAVFLGFGAWKASRLGIPGDDAANVLDGIDFLGKIAKDRNSVKLSGRVAVVGGGNTAFDCSRTALRLGAKEVVMIYRRTRDEMPANEIEKVEAEEEGIKFMFLTAPVEALKNGDNAGELVVRKMKLGEPDASGRRTPVAIEGSDYKEKFDFIITAVGQGPDYNVLGDYKDRLTDGRRLKYDKDTGVTGVDFVFAGGDCAIGAATVVEALGTSKRSAMSMVKFFKGEKIEFKKEFISSRAKKDGSIDKEYLDGFDKAERNEPVALSPDERKTNFFEIESTFLEDKVKNESSRCMECGCMDVYECKLKKYADDYEIDEYRFEGEIKSFPADNSSDYLYRDPSKCILCGRCIRLCTDKLKLGVYGYVDRGFDTTVAPEFVTPVGESDCVSCGLCISGCPVGAIVPKTLSVKNVPLAGKNVESVCFHCSIGCPTNVVTLKDSIYEIKEGGKYLCKKGRFNFPDYYSQSAPYNKEILKNFKDAVVYPSPSLSCEDYETVRKSAEKMNWKIANYYSTGALYQAFAASGVYPVSDFFKIPLAAKSIVIVAGDLETTNPTALNRLNDVVLADTIIISVNKGETKRLYNMKAKFYSDIKELSKLNLAGVNEIVLLINPVDVDAKFGFGASVELYNFVSSRKLPLRTTLLSEAKNMYQALDADKIAGTESARKIYIGTECELTAGHNKSYGITLVENGEVVLSIPVKTHYQTAGTFLNSRGEMYKAAGIFDNGVESVSDVLKNATGLNGDIALRKVNFSGEESYEFTAKTVKTLFPADKFIKDISSK